LANRGLVIDTFDFCQIAKSHLAIFNLLAGQRVRQRRFSMSGGEHFKMKTRVLQALVLLGLTGVSLAANVDKANTAVCARGVYRAGCVGPNGAVGVRRPVGAYRGGRYYGVRRGAVVIRR
jgi:hypothetical protein